MNRVLVVGAGLAGLACALRLADEGAPGDADRHRRRLAAARAAPRSTCSATTRRSCRGRSTRSGRSRPSTPTRCSGVIGSRPRPAGWPSGCRPCDCAGSGEREPAPGDGARRRPADGGRAGRVAAGDLRAGGAVVFASVTPCGTSSRALVAANVAAAAAVRCRRARPRRRSTCAATPTPRRSALARALERPDQRAGSLAALRSAIGTAAGARVGLPAALGIDRHAEVAAASRTRSAPRCSRSPTAPPSVPGIRLYRALAGRAAIAARAHHRRLDGGRRSARRRPGHRARGEGVGAHRAPSPPRRSCSRPAASPPAASSFTATACASRCWACPSPTCRPATVRYAEGAFDEQPLDRVGVARRRAAAPARRRRRRGPPNVHAAGAILRGAVPWRELSGNGLALASGLAAADADRSKRRRA